MLVGVFRKSFILRDCVDFIGDGRAATGGRSAQAAPRGTAHGMSGAPRGGEAGEGFGDGACAARTARRPPFLFLSGAGGGRRVRAALPLEGRGRDNETERGWRAERGEARREESTRAGLAPQFRQGGDRGRGLGRMLHRAPPPAIAADRARALVFFNADTEDRADTPMLFFGGKVGPWAMGDHPRARARWSRTGRGDDLGKDKLVFRDCDLPFEVGNDPLGDIGEVKISLRVCDVVFG